MTLGKPNPEHGSQYKRSIALAIAVSLLAVQLASAAPIWKGNGTLKGNWVVTVTRINPPPGLPPTFLSLQTYSTEGLFLEESNTNLIRSSARGEWNRTGLEADAPEPGFSRGQFSRSFFFFRFDASRNFIGTARNTARIMLSDDGQIFRAEATLELFDAAGNLLSTSQATETGRRQ
jgi:hypothetical protein